VEEKADQGTVLPLVIPEIVTLPAEIDISNAESVGRQLCAAARPGIAVVIADMSQTLYCDSSAVRSLMLAHDTAVRNDAELRLVIPSAAVLRILSVLGFDRILHLYPSLGAALTSSPGRPPETTR
jgi:anti-sigma B factor antagonist